MNHRSESPLLRAARLGLHDMNGMSLIDRLAVFAVVLLIGAMLGFALHGDPCVPAPEGAPTCSLD